MTTALIAEDEPLLATSLQAELRSLWPQLQIVASVGDGASAVTSALALTPDICFFDIRMPAMTGLEAAQALAEDWSVDGAAFPLIVFVTAYDQYALHAFEAQAVDYFVEPVERERLAAFVARLQSRLAERAPHGQGLQRSVDQLRALLGSTAPALAATMPQLQVVQAQVGAVVHMVPIADVLYFEAAGKYVPSREESGKVTLTLRGHADRLSASRLYAHLFRGQSLASCSSLTS